MTRNIGFVGLGNMGGPMVARLLAAGNAVQVFDIDQAAMQSAVAAGATPTASATECAQAAEVFMTSLPRPDHVEQVMLADKTLAALPSGSIWVDLTTNRKELIVAAAAAAPEGVAVVDAPVTGAVDGARQGKLTLFVGGDAETVARVEPILAQLGAVMHCGALGAGNITKLVTNQLWFVHAAALAEGFAVGTANGVELNVLWRAIKNSVGDSFVARHDAPSIFAGHYDPSFTLDLCLKDLALLQALATAVGTDLPMTEQAHATFQRATERYGREAGELHVARRIEDDAELSFRLDGDWVPHWEA